MADVAFEQSYSVLARIASAHAARTVRRHRLPSDARLDLQQDAVLELWRKRQLFDAERAGWLTFADRVITNRIRSQMRFLFAARRGYESQLPLHKPKDFAAMPDSRIDLRIDVERVLARVSRFDRAVAVGLAHLSASDVSRFLGVSRSSVYGAIERLRAVFTQSGLRSYNKRRRQVSAVGLPT